MQLFLSTPSARRATCPLRIRPSWTAYFYPRPPRGGRPSGCAPDSVHFEFLSTPSARRATYLAPHQKSTGAYFYPRPPRGGRPSQRACRSRSGNYFYPRPPRGGRQPVGLLSYLLGGFLSTPSARRATCDNVTAHKPVQFLSTPSARRATGKPPIPRRIYVISIHALREEGDFPGSMYYVGTYGFLSTPSARRATANRDKGFRFVQFLSTPSARRATVARKAHHVAHSISIHALREEGDATSEAAQYIYAQFLSTPSARRAT